MVKGKEEWVEVRGVVRVVRVVSKKLNKTLSLIIYII